MSRLLGNFGAGCYIQSMAKSVRKTTGKVTGSRDAATKRLLIRDKAGVFHEVLIQHGEVISRSVASSSQSTPNLRPPTVVVKQEHAVAAASGDETYDTSMKAVEDVFARFDWTLSELAK